MRQGLGIWFGRNFNQHGWAATLSLDDSARTSAEAVALTSDEKENSSEAEITGQN